MINKLCKSFSQSTIDISSDCREEAMHTKVEKFASLTLILKTFYEIEHKRLARDRKG